MATQTTNRENAQHQHLAYQEFLKHATDKEIEEFVDACSKLNPKGFQTWFTRLTVSDLEKIAARLGNLSKEEKKTFRLNQRNDE